MITKIFLKVAFLLLLVSGAIVYGDQPVMIHDQTVGKIVGGRLRIELVDDLTLVGKGRLRVDLIIEQKGIWPLWPTRSMRIAYATVMKGQKVEGHIAADGRVLIESSAMCHYLDGVLVVRKVHDQLRLLYANSAPVLENTELGGLLPIGQRPLLAKAGHIYDTIYGDWKVVVTEEASQALTSRQYRVWLVESVGEGAAMAYATVTVEDYDSRPADITLVIGRNGVLSVSAHRRQGLHDGIVVQYPQGTVAV